jgi:Asp-tRNA(Asn)/Glu-tRNA(Gln) amidotransferase A subunit family amidase
MQALDGLFHQCDALIGPFMTGPMLIASNFTGHPCLHLRAGFEELGTRSPASLGSGKLTTGEADASGRVFTVPQGISLWGRLFDEGPILNLGMALERELAVAARRPSFPSRADKRSRQRRDQVKSAAAVRPRSRETKE